MVTKKEIEDECNLNIEALKKELQILEEEHTKFSKEDLIDEAGIRWMKKKEKKHKEQSV